MAADHLAAVESLADDLGRAGFDPVLVGGMALVILGSQRITKDFDFLVASSGASTRDLVRIMYRHRLELVTKVGPGGEVLRTVDSPRVANAKIGGSQPRSLFFYNEKTGLRVDLLLDFPLPARSVVLRAAKVRLKTGRIAVASPEDLLRLKEIAHADRKSASDAQDLEFLRKILKKA